MRKTLLTLMVAVISLSLFAQIPSGYYDDAQGLSGESLKTELYYIIKDHNSQSYNSLWDHYYTTDDKPNGKVWDMYSDVPGGEPPYEFTFGSNQCGSYGGEGDCYNREHSFPKSWFNDASPMVTDIFHIVPTDGYVNGRRSNWPFGETNSASWTSENGSKVGSCSYPGYNGTIFEPIDAYKGDFARIYFYMATRYENLIASWENNSTNSDAALNGTSYPCYEEWYLNMLLEWHQNDPVSQKEIDRNDDIYYEVQGNRNPFVDHPEWVALVWGGVQAPAITNVSYAPQVPEENETVTVSATITDDGGIVSSQLLWGLNSSSLSNTVNMSASGNNYSAQIPGQSAGQEVYFKIKATDDEANTSLSSVYNYQVAENAGFISLPFTEDFNDETLGIFLDVSVTGAELTWHNDDYQEDYYAKMSNYNGTDNTENEDWLITPAINFDGYTNEKLNFRSAMKDYDDNNCFIYLMYSSNYSGTGDPNNATWTDISSSADWSAGDYAWTASGEISLASLTGGQVYLAFKYDSQAGSGKTWQIDDVSITIDGTSNTPPQITNLTHSPNIPEANEAATISATITDDGSIASAQVKWGLTSSNLVNTLNMSASGSTYTAQIPGQVASTTVYYKVIATDNESAVGQSNVESYTVAAASNTPPQISNVEHNPSLPEINEVVTVSASISDDGSISLAEIFWGFTSSSLSNQVSMTGTGNDYAGQIPGQAEGQMVYYQVKATDNDNATSESSIMNYTVASATNNPPQINNLTHTPNAPDEAEPVNITCNIIDDNAVAEAIIFYGLSSTSMSNQMNMTASGDVYSGTIPGQDENVTIYYQVKAIDDEAAFSLSAIQNFTVNETENIPPVINTVTYNPTQPLEAEEVIVTANITDDDAIESALILWGSSESSMSNIVTLSASGDNYSGIIPGQNEGITIYFKVQAFDNDSEMAESATYQYYIEITTNELALPFMEDFESDDLGVFSENSVSGDENVWHIDDFDDNLYAKMSNYNGSENLENEDWLISRPINFDNYSDEVLNFRNSMKDYSDNTTFIYVKYSSDYDGNSNPNEANWTDLSAMANWSPGEYEWVESGDIDLSAITGTEVYLAFQYVSEDGTGKTWQLDNVSVTLGGANTPPVISYIHQSPEEPYQTNEVVVSALITDDGNVENAEIQYGTSPTEMSLVSNLTGSADNYSGIIPAQEAGQTIYYRIMAEDNDGAISYSSIYNYYVDLYDGIQKISQANWKVYPNPANHLIKITSSFEKDVKLMIYHSSGKLILETPSYILNSDIDVSNLAPGMYFIRLIDNTQTESLNLIIR